MFTTPLIALVDSGNLSLAIFFSLGRADVVVLYSTSRTWYQMIKRKKKCTFLVHPVYREGETNGVCGAFVLSRRPVLLVIFLSCRSGTADQRTLEPRAETRSRGCQVWLEDWFKAKHKANDDDGEGQGGLHRVVKGLRGTFASSDE